MKALRSAIATTIAAAGTAFAPSAIAQPSADRVLTTAQAHDSDHCSVVKIGFGFPIRYVSHFPLDSGTQLSIRVRPIINTDDAAIGSREALSPPKSTVVNLTHIEYEGDQPDGPSLNLTFNQAAYYRLAQSPDFLGITIAISDVANNQNCTPQIPAAVDASTPPALRSSVTSMDSAISALTPDAKAQAVLDQARTAMTAKDYPRAIQLLTKFLESPENTSSPDAQELLGVARERNNQAAQAKGEYEEYLRRYPNASGAGRVRQRLATLLARALHPGEKFGAPGSEPPKRQWDYHASLSEYFYHDEMSTTDKDQLTQITIDNGLAPVQSQLVTALDASASMVGESVRASLVVSGSYTQDLLTPANDRLRIGQLYLEASDISRTYFARVGRQYRSTGGVLGRIDGALVTVGLTDQFKVDLIGGFPVDSSSSPFAFHRYAFGASVDYTQGPFSGDIYAFRQMDGSFLDRESVGFDGRYVDTNFSVFSTADYDLHFGQLNIALVNGNYIFADKSSINISADYRRSPMLRTSDALIGQPVTALSDLLSTYTHEEINQLALDRTADSTSLFANISHPLDDIFSVSLDATLWDMSGMPSSGGFPAIPSSGSQYYLSAHAIGSGIFTEGDLAMISAGYSKTDNSTRYTIDLNTRYPISRDLRVGPRIFLSYRDIVATEVNSLFGVQTILRPSLRIDYRFGSDVELELNGGPEWQRDAFNANTSLMTDYLIDFGLRWDMR